MRDGNTVTVTTRRVAGFTLLVSPGSVRLSQAGEVVADGKTVFEGTVKPDLATLLKWAAHDNDRTCFRCGRPDHARELTGAAARRRQSAVGDRRWAQAGV